MSGKTEESFVQEKLTEETSRIKNEYEEKLSAMKKMFEKEQSSKENLMDEMTRLKAEYDQKLNSVECQYSFPVRNLVSFFSNLTTPITSLRWFC